MRYFRKAQAVGNFRHRPTGVLQQRFGLLQQAARNEVGGGAAGGFFQHPVEVVDVHGQAVGVFAGRAQLQPLLGRVDGKLPLQQLDKQGADAGRSVLRRVLGRGRLQALPEVNQFQHVRAQQVVFVGVIGVDGLLHFLENSPQVGVLRGRYLEHGVAVRPENRQLIEHRAALGRQHKIGREHARHSHLVQVVGHPVVGDLGRGK
nr:hypothetical protein [Tanacetum cinerariifolium]